MYVHTTCWLMCKNEVRHTRLPGLVQVDKAVMCRVLFMRNFIHYRLLLSITSCPVSSGVLVGCHFSKPPIAHYTNSIS